MLSFFPRDDVLDGIWDLIGSVSEGFSTYFFNHSLISTPSKLLLTNFGLSQSSRHHVLQSLKILSVCCLSYYLMNSRPANVICSFLLNFCVFVFFFFIIHYKIHILEQNITV